MAGLPRDAERAARVRGAKRAAQVIDRAARMKAFKAPLVERLNRPFDPQMRTPGYDANAIRPDRIDGSQIKRLGMVEVPVDKIRSAQPSVSVAASKAKIGAASKPPQLVKRPDGTWSVLDGNHTITAARAQNAQTIKAYGGVIPGDKGGPLGAGAIKAAKSAASAYGRISPALQVGGIVAAGSTAFMHAREHNATLGEAMTSAGKAMAPGVVTMAGAAALARIAPAAAGALGKVNPVVLGGAVAYNAARGAWEGYHAPARDRTWGEWAKGQQPPKAGVTGALKGAAFGAADTLTFGIASAVAGRSREVKVPKDWDPISGGRPRADAAGPSVRLSSADATQFSRANAAYEQAARTEPQGPTRAGYKDTWSDSRGRNYTRHNMAVRKRQGMKEAA